MSFNTGDIVLIDGKMVAKVTRVQSDGDCEVRDFDTARYAVSAKRLTKLLPAIELQHDDEILQRVKLAWNGHSAGLEELLSAVQLLAELADQGVRPLEVIKQWGQSPYGLIPYRRVMLERESE